MASIGFVWHEANVAERSPGRLPDDEASNCLIHSPRPITVLREPAEAGSHAGALAWCFFQRGSGVPPQ